MELKEKKLKLWEKRQQKKREPNRPEQKKTKSAPQVIALGNYTR